MKRLLVVALSFLMMPGIARALDAQAPRDVQDQEWERVFEASSSMHQYGKHEHAATLAQKAVQLAEEKWGPEHFHVAQSLMLQGNCLEDQGQFEQAEAAYKRALAIAEKALDQGDPTVMGYAFCLGSVYRKTGREKDAAILEDRYKATLKRNVAEQKRPNVSPEGRPGGNVAP